MIINDIINGIRGAIMRLFNLTTIEQATGITTCVSAEMRDAIDMWAEIFSTEQYFSEEHKGLKKCGIEQTLCHRLATPIGEEMETLCNDNEELQEAMARLNEDSFKIVSYMVCMGACVCRPVFSNGRVQYELIPLGNYMPTRYDIDGTLTGAVIMKPLLNGKQRYVLAEDHKYENGTHTVTSKLFLLEGGDIMKNVPLTTIPQTADITETFAWQNVKEPFIVEFRNRDVNRIDGSDTPVALIQGIEDVLLDADKQYENMIWEQDSGTRRVFANMDMFAQRQGKKNQAEGPHLDATLNKLIVKTNMDAGTPDSDKITQFSPELRTEAQKAAFQEILKRIEQATGTGSGTLSDVQAVQQTATQYAGGKKELYNKVNQFESEIENKYKHCAYVFAYMLSAYTGIPFNSDCEVTYNDMSRKDPQQEKQIAMQEVSAGLKQKWEYRRDFYGEDEETAKANVPQTESMNAFIGG